MPAAGLACSTGMISFARSDNMQQMRVRRELEALIKRNRLDEAERFLVEAARAEGVLEVVMWNMVMSEFKKQAKAARVLHLLRTVQHFGRKPDVVSYNILIDTCGKAGELPNALGFFDEMRTAGLQPTVNTYTSLIDACGKAGELGRAYQLLEQMQAAGVWPNACTFTTLVNACASTRHFDLGLHVLECMARSGLDCATDMPYTNLIRACGKGLEMDKAFAALHAMLGAGALPTLPTFNFLIEFSGKARRLDLACHAFVMLQAHYEPEPISFAALIGACAFLGEVGEAHRLLEEMIVNRRLKPTDGLCSVVLGAAARHGCLELAFATLHLHERAAALGATEVVRRSEYDALVEACAAGGAPHMAFDALRRMVAADALPTRRTYCALLGACRGEQLFNWMGSVGVAPPLHDLSGALLEACADSCALSCAHDVATQLEWQGTLPSLDAVRLVLAACVTVGDLRAHGGLQARFQALGVPLERMLSAGCAPYPLPESTWSTAQGGEWHAWAAVALLPVAPAAGKDEYCPALIRSPTSTITSSTISSSPTEDDSADGEWSTC